MYVLGWIPQGPLFAIDPEDHQIYESWELVAGDPVFYPPMPYPFERFPVADPTSIINPAHERID
jgi:hypothetical protein